MRSFLAVLSIFLSRAFVFVDNLAPLCSIMFLSFVCECNLARMTIERMMHTPQYSATSRGTIAIFVPSRARPSIRVHTSSGLRCNVEVDGMLVDVPVGVGVVVHVVV